MTVINTSINTVQNLKQSRCFRNFKTNTKAPNQYLRYALQNTREIRLQQEKVQKAQDNLFKQLMRNSEIFYKNNLYSSVSNLANIEMEQDESNCMEICDASENLHMGIQDSFWDQTPDQTNKLQNDESIPMELSEEFNVSSITEMELQQEISTSQYSTLDTSSIKDFLCLAF